MKTDDIIAAILCETGLNELFVKTLIFFVIIYTNQLQFHYLGNSAKNIFSAVSSMQMHLASTLTAEISMPFIEK